MKFKPAYLIRYFHEKIKRDKGVGLIELCFVAFLLIVIVALGLDMGILIFASDACDKTCKDCARAAGTGRTPGDAINAMNAALAVHSAQLNPLVMSQLTAQLMVYEDYSPNTPLGTTGSNGPTQIPGGGGIIPLPSTQVSIWLTNSQSVKGYTPGPYVVVRTTAKVTLPAPIFFFGANLAPNQVQVASAYPYPLTHPYAPVVVAASPILPNPNVAENAGNAAANSSTSTHSTATSANSTNSTTSSTSTDKGSGTTSTSSASSTTGAHSTSTAANSTSTAANASNTASSAASTASSADSAGGAAGGGGTVPDSFMGADITSGGPE